MNILFLTQYFEPHRGGIETVVRNESRVLAAKGHTVTVITSRFGKEPAEERVDGVTVLRIRALNWSEQLLGVPYALFMPGLSRTVRTYVAKADIVHAHGALYLTTIAARKACRALGKPLIVTEHVSLVPYKSTLLRFAQRMAYRTVGRRTYGATAALIALNADIRANIIAFGGDAASITLLTNGTDTKLFHPGNATEKRALRAKQHLPLDQPVLLFVGRFVEKKGFRLLLDSLGEDYLVLCVGDGEIPSEFSRDARVRFFPACNQQLLAPLYRLSDAFILPSQGEGFPAAIQEAMASGLPIITTENPGYDTYLDRRFSQRIADRTPAAVRAAIQSVIGKRNTKRSSAMAAYSVRTARAAFSWDKHVRTLVAVYKEARA